jgi:hypothetical protein
MGKTAGKQRITEHLDPVIALTQEVSTGGCAAKVGPSELASVLASLPKTRDRNVLVGSDIPSAR